MGSTAENSPLRLAANNPTSRSARDSGTPCEISPARHSASGRVTRVTVCPVSSDAISAMSARSRDCQPVSGGVIPLRLPSSVSAITAAAARSACEVQETLPSAGATSLPVSGALPGNDSFSEGHEGTRGKIVSAAIRLLNHGGRDAVTTRAVAEAAGVQAPTIYRLFGDKGRLLDAVAEYGFAAYLGQRRSASRVRTRSRICEPAGIFMLTLDCPIPRCTHLCIVIRNQEPVLLPQLQATSCSGNTSGALPRQAAYG